MLLFFLKMIILTSTPCFSTLCKNKIITLKNWEHDFNIHDIDAIGYIKVDNAFKEKAKSDYYGENIMPGSHLRGEFTEYLLSYFGGIMYKTIMDLLNVSDTSCSEKFTSLEELNIIYLKLLEDKQRPLS